MSSSDQRGSLSISAARNGSNIDRALPPNQQRAILLPRTAMRGDRGDDVADPSQKPAGADPQSGCDDQPEDTAEKIAVIKLPDAWDDRAEHRRDSRGFHVSHP